MADLFCDFLYFQSLTTNYNLPLFLPPKQYFSSSLHSHNSRFSKLLRPSPHLQLLHNHKPSPFAVSASEIDLISIHEHSDGSFLFRFGDPSEVEKNVEMEESKIIKEEIEGEDTDMSSVVPVMESEDETEGTASVLTEASDRLDSIVVSSNTLIAVKGDSESSKKLLAIPVDTELPVLTSNEEDMGGISSQDLDMEQIKYSEGLNEEYRDSVPTEASIPDESTAVKVFYEETSNVTFTSKEMENNAIPSIDIGQQAVNVEESINKEDVDPPADTSMLDQSSEVVDNITTVALLEKETDDITSAGIDANQIGRVEEDLDGDYKDTPADASVLDKSSEVENEISAVVLMDNETDGSTSTSSDIEIEPTENVEECISEENEDSLVDTSALNKRAEVLNNTKAALSEKEGADLTSAPCEDSPVDVTVLDKSSEVEYGISAVVLLEEKTGENTSTRDIEIEPIGNVEKGKNEEFGDSLGDASVLDESSEVKNGISAVVLLENEAYDGTTSTTDIEIEPTGNMEDRINEEYEGSLVDTSVLDKRDEVLDNTKAAFSENEASDVTAASYEDSPVDASVNKSSEVNYGISPVVLLEEETDGNTSTRDIEIEPIGDVEEGKNEEYEDSPADASVHDKRYEIENEISDVVLLENKTDDGNTSTSDNDIQPTGNVEERIHEEYEESLVDTSVQDKRAEVLNNTREALSEKEPADITSAPYEDSPVDASVFDKSPKAEYGISAVVEEEADGNTSTRDIEADGNTSAVDKRAEILINDVAASSEKEVSDVAYGSDIDIEDTDNVEQSLDEVLEQPSSVDASRSYQRPEVENVITAQEFLEKETTNATTPVALKNDPEVSALDIDAGQGGLETVVTTNLVTISELHNTETAIHDEKIGDDRESVDDKLVSPSSESELGMSLYEETEVPKIQAAMQNLATEESSETDVHNTKVVEMPNVLSNDTEGDTYDAEDDTLSTEPAMVWSLGSEEQVSGSGSGGMPNETVGYESEKDVIHLMTSSHLEADSVLEEETGIETVEEPRTDDGSENQTVGGTLAEALVHEMTAPESTESTITSQEILVTGFVLYSGAALLPHPSKVLTGGEDAYFIADQTWLGVADGVGQWSLDGTTPGGYAQELIKNCENIISDCSGNLINPLELLNLCVSQTQSPGSSTVLIAHFDGQALHVANVGDSGFIILRHGAVYKRSSPMHHVFSLPVRIGRGDDPSSLAQLYKVDLEEEDIIVIATDGLLDNLYNQEILLIAMKSLADDKTPKEIAELLAKRAQEVGSSASARSPFSDEAQAAGFPAYSGGMLDDVAVIVSVVQRR